MRRITYMSASSHVLKNEELEQLLRQSQALNLRDDVTGLLLHHNGSFIQVIEGPPDELGDTLARIKADPRHHGVIVVEDRPITDREFLEWAMAFQPSQSWTPRPDSAFLRLGSLVRGEVQIRRAPGHECSPYLSAFVQSFREFQ